MKHRDIKKYINQLIKYSNSEINLSNEQILDIEEKISSNLTNSIEEASFFELPFDIIQNIIHMNVEKLDDYSFDSIKTIFKQMVKKYNNKSILLLNSLINDNLSWDDCFEILEILSESCPFFKLLVNYRHEQDLLPVYDYEDSIKKLEKTKEELSSEIEKLKQENKDFILNIQKDVIKEEPSPYHRNIVLAAELNDIDSIKYSLNLFINQTSMDRCTALSYAAINNNLELAKFLIYHGADIEASNMYEARPIQLAAWNKAYDVFVYLAELGADFEQRNFKGFTSILSASKIGCLSIVKYLVEHGANIEAKDKWGYTALYRAKIKGHQDIVDYLIAHGANKEEMNRSPEFDEDPT